jgi:hypothetical protein
MNIGRGCFGIVYKAQGNSQIAIKEIDFDSFVIYF